MNTNWIPESIIYQINLRSLAAREPRNAIEAVAEPINTLSPLAYVTQHLDTLQALGMTVLHLMPPFPIGWEERKGIGSPYAVMNYYEVEPELGTRDELAAFVQAAHERDLKVIIGMVPNHTSRDNIWIQPHPEYYIQNEQDLPAYDLDWSDTAKLDYTNPGLRNEMLNVMDHWLSFLGMDDSGYAQGVDGFRIDMAHFINDRTFWNDALAELRNRHPDRSLLFLAECYGTDNNLDLFQRGMNAAYDDEFYKICEWMYALDENGESCIRLSPDASGSESFADKLHAFQQGGIAGAAEAALMTYETQLPDDEWAPRLARYTDNHDEGRSHYRFGNGCAMAMNQLLFMSHHALPFLLTGQEFGALNRPSIHERIGPCDKGQRVFSQQNDTTRAGIEFEGNIFARTRDERQDWYQFYKNLIQLRRTTPALKYGQFVPLDVGECADKSDRQVLAFARQWRGTLLHGAVNLGPAPRTLKQSELLKGQTLYGELDGQEIAPFSAILSEYKKV